MTRIGAKTDIAPVLTSDGDKHAFVSVLTSNGHLILLAESAVSQKDTLSERLLSFVKCHGTKERRESSVWLRGEFRMTTGELQILMQKVDGQ